MRRFRFSLSLPPPSCRTLQTKHHLPTLVQVRRPGQAFAVQQQPLLGFGWVKLYEHSPTDCSALIDRHGSHFGDLTRQHLAMLRESVWEGKSSLPKTKKGYRKLVLTGEQMEILREYKAQNFPDAQPTDWVLPGKRGRPIDLGWLMSKYIKPLAHELGIPELHLSALRHLNNSIMLNEGVDMKTRMDRLGHTHERVNIIYSHVGDQAQIAASEAVWQKLKTAESEYNRQPVAA